jgi:hypothetical protein
LKNFLAAIRTWYYLSFLNLFLKVVPGTDFSKMFQFQKYGLWTGTNTQKKFLSLISWGLSTGPKREKVIRI